MGNNNGANAVAASKASAGIFINLALVIYTLGVIYKFILTIDSLKEKVSPQIKQYHRLVMFLGALFLMIGLSRTIGSQYDLTRFFILAIMFSINMFFDELYDSAIAKKKKNKKKNKNKEN